MSSLLLIEIRTRGVYLAKLLAKYLEELSGQPVENGCLDPTFIDMILQGFVLA